LSSDRPMTPEYARLSLRAGYLAAAIENSIGWDPIGLIRERGWDLTETFLGQVKAEAVARGMPAAELEQAERQAAAFSDSHHPHRHGDATGEGP
jgi:hypothetical protein